MRDPENCKNLIESLMQKRACVIWGTKLAGRLALDVCRALDVEVKAFGDNTLREENEKIEGIPIISAEQLRDMGSTVVILGSFFCRIGQEIKRQLYGINKELIFVPFEAISYYHEILLTDRKIASADKYFEVLQNVWIDEKSPWRCQTDHYVLARYCYRVADTKFDDLLLQLDKIDGITELCLIIKSEKLTEDMLYTVREKLLQDKIGHLILVTDGQASVSKEIWRLVKRTFYYVSVDQGAAASLQNVLGECAITYELAKYNPDLFTEKTMKNVTVTEDLIYRTVCDYAGKVPGKKYDDISQVIIVQLFNGLANQMLMYLFGRFLEINTGKKVIFDDTVLMIDVTFEEENVKRIRKWLPKVSDREVRDMVEETRRKSSFYYFDRAEVAEVFPIKINLLSDYFAEETWREYLDKARQEFYPVYAQSFPLGQLLLKNGIALSLIQDSLMPEEIIGMGKQMRANVSAVGSPFDKGSITNFFVQFDENAYYMGVWATGGDRDWLYYNRDFVRESFKFKAILHGKNQFYYENIVNSDAVIVHIRRGDFINVGWAMDEEYVKQSLLRIKELMQGRDLQYFIFSDDQEWCEETLAEFIRLELEKTPYFIRGNEGRNSYLDLYLMSMGKIYVPSAVSSFSYLARLLSENLECYVDVQKYLYYKKEYKETVIDLCRFE